MLARATDPDADASERDAGRPDARARHESDQVEARSNGGVPALVTFDTTLPGHRADEEPPTRTTARLKPHPAAGAGGSRAWTRPSGAAASLPAEHGSSGARRPRAARRSDRAHHLPPSRSRASVGQKRSRSTAAIELATRAVAVWRSCDRDPGPARALANGSASPPTVRVPAVVVGGGVPPQPRAAG